MFDPIFNVLTWLLEQFYDLVPSYGFAIIALTALVLGVLSPLTYRSTKSMVQMRQLQPQIKRLQKKHKGDREALNQEMMALYQEHSVSPLSGCLPILIQSPVFFIMFRVIRGITRRSSDVGYDAGLLLSQRARLDELGGSATILNPDSVPNKFNPEYLDPDSAIYQSLIEDNEMLWLGIDLARTPLEVVQNDIGSAFPYLAAIALVAFLGWYQQRQIQGRMTGDVSAQQQMIMKILPWMLPIFSFTMPGGLVLYFIVSAALRITQQAYITRSIYQNEELNAPIDFGDDDDDDDEDDDGEPENPLSQLFGGGAAKKPKGDAAPSSRHGSRRPTSSAGPAKRNRPASSVGSKGNGSRGNGSKGGSSKGSSSSAKSNGSTGSSKGARTPKGKEERVSGWGRAKRSAPKSNEPPAKPVSRRVTPKGESSSKNRRGKK